MRRPAPRDHSRRVVRVHSRLAHRERYRRRRRALVGQPPDIRQEEGSVPRDVAPRGQV